MRITKVRAITCDVPLPHPIVMGSLRFPTRDYTIVEIQTDEGFRGIGFGMARYSPVAEMIERNIAPLLVGQDPLLTARLWETAYATNLLIGQRGVFMRALSLVDIALWDLKGKVAGLPVWRLLGGSRPSVPVLMAGGYARPGKTIEHLGAELRDYVARGFSWIKIAAGELAEDTDRLRASREAVGPGLRLIYDAHWQWRDLPSVERTVRSWGELDLMWLEDPFPSEMVALTARLRSRTGVPVGMGEDASGRWAFAEILRQEAADVLRVDVTVAGGFSEVARICALAATAGVPVSPHVFPELHVHLAAAYEGVVAVEMTDPAQGLEGMHRLLKRTLAIADGIATAPEEPGLGCEIDWSVAERFARRPAP